MVGNPIVFVEAEKLGVTGGETRDTLDANQTLIDRAKEVRGRMAQQFGKCQDWRKVDEESPMLPMVAIVSKATSSSCDIQSRLFLDNHCHPSMAGTAGICTTAVSRIHGSVVNRLLSPGSLESDTLSIQHPLGHLPINVKLTADSKPELPAFALLSFVRTARYLMQGQLFIPADIQEKMKQSPSEPVTQASVAIKTQDEQSISHATREFQTEASPKATPQVTEALVAFTQSTNFENLPEPVLERLRQCLLDHIGVASLGAKVGESSPAFTKAVDAMTANSTGTTTVVGSDRRLPTEYAAMLNAAFAHTLDFDDTHTGGNHPRRGYNCGDYLR